MKWVFHVVKKGCKKLIIQVISCFVDEDSVDPFIGFIYVPRSVDLHKFMTKLPDPYYC